MRRPDPTCRTEGISAFLSELCLQGQVLRSLMTYSHLAARMKWSREKVRSFQHRRLRNALQRAASSVPFHRERAPADVTDLCRWPLTSRSDLQITPRTK